MKETEQTLLDQIKLYSEHEKAFINKICELYATAKAKASCEATLWKKHIQQEELWDDAISIGESEKSRKSAIHKIMKSFTITRNP